MNLKATPSVGLSRSQLLNPVRTGFTLIELLAVMAILALCLAMLTPISDRTRSRGTAVQCLRNAQQLGAAWQMYAADFAGQLVYNQEGTQAGKVAGNEAWVAGWLTLDSPNADNNPENTNTLYLVDHEATPYGAFLGLYIKTPAPFKCPEDKTKVTIHGQQVERARSVSMNNCFGLKSRSWTNASRFCLFTNLAQIQAPAHLFVFVEEHPGTIDDGCFVTDPDTPYHLLDYPASFHNQGCAFSFADGHSEIHRWKSPRICPPLRPGKPLPTNQTFPGDVDVEWIQQRASQPLR